MRSLESFQERAVTWIIGSSYESYGNNLRRLIVLRIPMFMQMNDILLFDIIQCTNNQYPKLPAETPLTTRNREIFKLTKSGTEKLRGEFILKTCRNGLKTSFFDHAELYRKKLFGHQSLFLAVGMRLSNMQK